MKKTTSVLDATVLGLAALAATSAVPAADRPVPSFAGPLRVHRDNPRYFTDDTGRAIFLTGAHTWNNLQDNAVYPPVDFARYLDFLEQHNHNFIRMWAWEQAGWDPWSAGHTVVEPAPFARTGPGKALDGKPKFDVTKFNEEYFLEFF